MAPVKINPTKEVLLSTSYAMIILTSLVFMIRGAVRITSPKGLAVTDLFLALAYVIFLAETILYIVTFPRIYRMNQAAAGLIPMYATISDDVVLMRKVLLINSYLLWSCLWSVKGSFLCLYYNLVKSLPKYFKVWWILVVYVILAFLCNVPAHLVSCRKLDFFVAAGCMAPADVQGQLVSLYYSFTADVTTDLAVMFLPLFVIRKLQVDKKKKFGIAGLFCIGWICIFVATIRVIKLGEGKGQFIPGWLAMWGTIESAIAVIVGCGPGLYITMKEAYRSRAAQTYGSTGDGSGSRGRKWYAKDKSYDEMGSDKNAQSAQKRAGVVHPRNLHDAGTRMNYELGEVHRDRKESDEPLASTKTMWIDSESVHNEGSDHSLTGHTQSHDWPMVYKIHHTREVAR